MAFSRELVKLLRERTAGIFDTHMTFSPQSPLEVQKMATEALAAGTWTDSTQHASHTSVFCF